jgi:polar amino acid transport system substrate-binding protein
MLISRLLWLVLLFIPFIPIGHAAEHDASTPVFLIADVWPWGYLDENNQPAGLIETFASRLAARADIEMHIRVLPHQRVLSDFERGDADYTLLFENPLVDSFADRVGMTLEANILLIALQRSSQRLTLPALAGRTLGYIRGTYYGEAFQADTDIIKLPLSSLDQAIKLLQRDRLEALITSDILLHHSLQQAQLDPRAFRARVLTRGHAAYLYATRDNPAPPHATAVRAALVEMRESGEMQAIFRGAMALPPLVTE